jgi:GDP-L-fucose synthase
MNKNARIFASGHRGLVGSAIIRKLESSGYNNIIKRTKEELDLRNQSAVFDFFQKEKPGYVILAAAKVGGIMANYTYQADFIYDNLMIACNVIKASYKYGVKKLLNLGSSCIYPKMALQPLKEEYILSGYLEPTNESYAIAKIAALKMCRYFNQQYGTNFISVMPSNLYGPNDNFNLETSHVLPALIRKFYEANKAGINTVTLWGDGTPRREFLHVDDLADACILIMEKYNAWEVGEVINIGTGYDITIKELAGLIADIIGYSGNTEWDTSKPNGTPRKLLDVSRIERLGWKSKITLKDGLLKTIKWYEKQNIALKKVKMS